MTQHLIDTPPRLGNCVRCGAYVLTALVCGGWTGVNTAPLSAVELRALLASGERPYRLRTAAGRAQALTVASLGDIQAGTPVLGPHRCGGHPMDARAFREAPTVPLRPPANATGRPDRPSVSEARRGTNQRAATPVIPHRSRPVRCDTCRRLIEPCEPYWGIECGTYIWAVHDVCPEVERQ